MKRLVGLFLFASAAENYDRKDIREKEARSGLFNLGWHLVKEAPPGNTVVSPFCVAGVLHMLAAGSVGETREEVYENGLGLEFSKYKKDSVFYPKGLFEKMFLLNLYLI